MFGFSLTKLIVLVAAILAVWYGFRYISRLQYQKEERARLRDKVDRRADGRPATGGGRNAEDTALCAACKAYVPAKGAHNCGRPDCPY